MLEIPKNVKATGPDPSRASTEFCPFDPSFRVDQFKNKNLEKEIQGKMISSTCSEKNSNGES